MGIDAAITNAISLDKISSYWYSGGLKDSHSLSVKIREMAINLKPIGISKEKLDPRPSETSTVMCEYFNIQIDLQP